jgi:DNA topoisomerase-1
MGKSLVIVESPAKARTINRYLGKNFVVKSSVGHVRDLPVSGGGRRRAAKAPPKRRTKKDKERAAREALVRRMGVDPERSWQAEYEVLPGKEKVLNELRRLAENADAVYLATDLDREGEAIAWHLSEVIGGDASRFKRVVFSEITKRAIEAAFAEPGRLNHDRINAQQARRFLDRVVGFMLSPLLWEKVARGLSAGRVQSVALRMIVEREREIHAFNPEEYWEIAADLRNGGGPFRAQVIRVGGENFRPGAAAAAHEAVEHLRAARFQLEEREDKPTSSRPSPPFITSTLQQAASVRLGFPVKKTMSLAQQLYEGGHITYMRTDSTNLSGDALGSCRSFIENKFGREYLPEKPQTYAAKKGAQEAHEAIRPTDVTAEPGKLEGVGRDAARLYELIWRQFVACQMPAARYDTTTLRIGASGSPGAPAYTLRARGRILRFDGWTRVLKPVQKKGDEDSQLPPVQQGETLELLELEPSQHFTKPPARYTEASLVRELEKRGIGRPSTYASIISTIQERGYVRLERRRFYAEKMGEIVADRLVENFPDLMDYSFTANMEDDLDQVAQGERNWRSLLDEFYADFRGKLAQAQKEMRPNDPTPTPVECPACGRTMVVRTGKTGVFLGCSGYSLPPKERCNQTLNLVPGQETVNVEADEEETQELRSKRRCPKCGTAMDSYLIDQNRRLHVCGNLPDCDGIELETGSFKVKGYEGPVIDCDKCGAEMQLKQGRFGKYFGCTRYPECRNTRKLLRNGEPAPPKADPVPMPELPCEQSDGHFVLRDGAAGIFLASSNYPRSRETRAPAVEDLARHRDELDPKLLFLADAPQRDPQGRPALIRFARKTKSYYLMSEEEGKPTGWRAFWRNGQWVQEEKERRPKKARRSTG